MPVWPDYFLQHFDRSVHPVVERVIPIHKEVMLWEEDPVLQNHLATEVIIRGRMVEGFLHYQEVHAAPKLATVP